MLATGRWGLFTVFVLAALSFAPSRIAAQSCVGDCNSSGNVSVDELLVGLNIALRNDGVEQCTAFDRTTDGAVSIDELVVGVRNAIQGCGFGTGVVQSSSSVALSSLFVISFGSLGATGSGSGAAAQSLTLGTGPTPATLGGGLGSSCNTLFCPFGGTEVRCCDLGVLTFDWSQCILSDGTEVNGSYAVESFDEDACFFGLPSVASAALAPPIGIHFFLSFTDYSQAAGNLLGNFAVFLANFSEEFEPFGAECGLISSEDPLADPLGFAIRGDGTRYLHGSIRTVVGNGPSIFQDTNTTFGDSEGSDVTVDVIIEDDVTQQSCVVDTQLDGTFSTTNLLTDREYTETYDEYLVLERADSDGSLLIEVDGTSTTDCLGTVGVFTREPLKIVGNSPCPVGGQLELQVPGQPSSSVFYTVFGGVDYDYDSDGSIDDTTSSCLDVSANECGVQRPQAECKACSGQSECGSPLICAPCVFCDTGQQSRCAPEDDFVICDDGVFGSPFISF